MAKRKRKRKNKNLIKLLSLIPLVLGIAVLAMMFLEVVNYTGNLTGTQTKFTGFQVIFGVSEKAKVLSAVVETEVLSFSGLALLAVLLPLLAGVIHLSNNRIVKLVAFAIAITGAVLLFIMPNFVVFASSGFERLYGLASSSLGMGAIVAGVLATIESLLILVGVLYK